MNKHYTKSGICFHHVRKGGNGTMSLIEKEYALEKAENQYYLNVINEQTKNEIINFIKSLPSAQLDIEEKLDDAYAHGYSDAESKYRALMDKDGCTIYRQAAIDIVVFECGKWTGLAKEISKQLKQLPSAQPERPKGHWIFDFAHNEMTCSECGRTFTGGFDLENADNFCRHCGSDNRGEQDE